jgi:ATP-dependent Lon protease
VKEKVLAAYRFGLKKLILPKENEKDLAEIPEDISKEISFLLVESMDEVLENAFVRSVTPLKLHEPDAGEGMAKEPADGSITH